MGRRKGQWICKRKKCRKSNFEFSDYCRRCGKHRTKNKFDYDKIEEYA